MSFGRAITLLEAVACCAVGIYALHGAHSRDVPTAPIIPLIVGIRMLFKNADQRYHTLPALLLGTCVATAACFAALGPAGYLPRMQPICILLFLAYLYVPKFVSPRRSL